MKQLVGLLLVFRRAKLRQRNSGDPPASRVSCDLEARRLEVPLGRIEVSSAHGQRELLTRSRWTLRILGYLLGDELIRGLPVWSFDPSLFRVASVGRDLSGGVTRGGHRSRWGRWGREDDVPADQNQDRERESE